MTAPQHPSEPEPTPRGAWALFVVLVLYLVIFYAASLTSLPAREDGPWRRYELFQYLLAPEVLWDEWTGGTGVAALGDRLTVLGPAAWTALTALALGYVLLLACGAHHRLTRAETLIFSAAVGGSCLSGLVCIFGRMVGLAAPAKMFAAEAAVIAVAAVAIWLNRRAATRHDNGENAATTTHEGPAPTTRADTHWFLAIVGVCGLFAAVTILGAMLPPVEFDVREYHLQAPKEFFQNGRIRFLPHNVYANMPLGLEMFSLHGMALTGDVWRGALVGKTLIAGMGLLAGAGVFLVGRRWFGRSDAYWGLLVFLTTPWVVRESTAGLIDVALGAYVILAIHAALIWRSQWQDASTEGVGTSGADRASGAQTSSDRASGALLKTWPLLALAGFFAGSAAACKYPAAVLVTLPLGIWALWIGRRKPIQTALGYGIPAFAALGVWLYKNDRETGNPVYPLLFDWLGGATRTAELNAQWTQAHAPHGFGIPQLADSAASALVTSDWLSPLAWPLALVAWRLAVPRGLVRSLIGYVALFMALWWLATHRIDRFWLPMWPVLAVAAGTGAAALDEGRTRWPFRALATLCVAANLLYSVIAGPGAYNRFFVALDAAWNDPMRVAPWQVWLNRNVPPDKAVLCVGEAEVFDLKMRVHYNTAFDPCRIEELTAGRSGAEIRAVLAQENVSHVVVRWDEIERYRSPGNYGYSEYVTPELFDTLVEQGVLERPVAVFQNGSVEVYPVKR